MSSYYSSSSSSSPPWTKILILIAVIILIVVVIDLVANTKNKKNQSHKPQNNDPHTQKIIKEIIQKNQSPQQQPLTSPSAPVQQLHQQQVPSGVGYHRGSLKANSMYAAYDDGAVTSNLNNPQEYRKDSYSTNDNSLSALTVNKSKSVLYVSGAEAREMIQKHKRPVVVAFVSDGCGHCVEMKPAYETASQSADLPFLVVNANDHDGLATEFGLKGVPTVLRCENGVVTKEYAGPRDTQSFVLFGSN